MYYITIILYINLQLQQDSGKLYTFKKLLALYIMLTVEFLTK